MVSPSCPYLLKIHLTHLGYINKGVYGGIFGGGESSAIESLLSGRENLPCSLGIRLGQNKNTSWVLSVTRVQTITTNTHVPLSHVPLPNTQIIQYQFFWLYEFSFVCLGGCSESSLWSYFFLSNLLVRSFTLGFYIFLLTFQGLECVISQMPK